MASIASIKTQWENFENQVIPSTATAKQRMACQQSFYAGALSLMESIIYAAKTKTVVPVDNVFNDFHDEIMDFFENAKSQEG